MPSRNQPSGSGREEYESEIEKYLRTKNMRTVLALVDGIQREAEARRWLGECNRIGVHEDVESRVVERVRELADKE